jgi:HD-GYP domain-containing protein (c-di-GMP phosphodiesterase class II)
MSTARSENLLEVPVDKLRLGMFVAELDRPWLETPFAIQGFYVRTLSDVQALQKYCAYVYVDFTAPPADDEERPAIPRRPSLWQRLRNWFRRLFGKRPAAVGAGYQDLVSFEDELPHARTALDEATDAVRDALERIAAGRPPDLPELRNAVETVVASLLRNRDAVSALVRMRHADEYTWHHAMATGVWAVLLGRHLGLDEESLNDLGLGGTLLDLGKARLPKELITRPEALDDSEWMRMRTHVTLSLDAVRGDATLTDRVREMIATHHERHDGSGYPRRLKGTEIPVFGRIAGIADSYDAMISRRPWAAPRSSFAAMRELQKLADTRFQREMVEQFMQAIGSFPPGTLVELNTGEVAVVVAENRARRLKPKVMLLLDADKKPRDRHLIIDLYEPDLEDSLSGGTWIVHGLEAGAYDIDAEAYFL